MRLQLRLDGNVHRGDEQPILGAMRDGEDDAGRGAHSQAHSSHSHAHRRDLGRGHEHGSRRLVDRGRTEFESLFWTHSHDAADSVDQALESSHAGIRAVGISFVVLLATGGVQALVVASSGSVALLGDALHNAADGLTAIPLWLAFRLGRRPPTRRFTYGFGKAEDLAGLVVITLIALSAALAGYEAIERLLHPQTIRGLGLVMAAALVGAIGNEVVAQYRIRTGRRIGSAALEADGIHARTDGVTSLLVLFGAIGVALGAPWADPAVGLVITSAIVVVGYQAARGVGQRLLDAVDPAIVDAIRETVTHVPGVIDVTQVRARWAGHRLLAQLRLGVEGNLTVAAAHEIGEVAHHELLHAIDNLSDAIIHVDPSGVGVDPHASTRHHETSVLGSGSDHDTA